MSKSLMPQIRNENEVKYKNLLEKICTHLDGYPTSEDPKELLGKLFKIDCEICGFKNSNREEYP